MSEFIDPNPAIDKSRVFSVIITQVTIGTVVVFGVISWIKSAIRSPRGALEVQSPEIAKFNFFDLESRRTATESFRIKSQIGPNGIRAIG